MPGAPPGAPNSDGAPPLQPPGTVGDGAGSTSTANESGGPGGSNTTSQTIWQVEISGCLSECQGTSQIQTAEQQNTTVQELDGTAAVPTAAETQTGLDTHSQSTADIGQIRLGCVADCFGTTSTMSAAISTKRSRRSSRY